MSNQNAPYTVLVTSGDQAVLAAGNSPSALAAGQIGVFDKDTNLSVNAASTNVRNIYLAVGTDGGNDVRKSVGDKIPMLDGLIQGYTLRCFNPGQNQIIRIEDFNNGAKCATEYGLRIEFRGNTRIYQEMGAAQLSKTFVVKTPCCDECNTDCPTADPNYIAKIMVDEINADTENSLVSAFLYESSGTPSYAAVDYDTWVGAGNVHTDGDYLGIQLTITPEAAKSFCEVPAQYYKLRGFKMIVTGLGGFACGETVNDLLVTITEAQTILMPEGESIDVKNLEYESGAYSGEGNVEGFRVADLKMLPFQTPTYLAVDGAEYLQASLSYMQQMYQGGRSYEHMNETVVAIPRGDTTTRDALFPILDAMLSRTTFGPLADDAAACSGAAQQTSALTAETEGIDVQ